jgi:hypothetical protein
MPEVVGRHMPSTRDMLDQFPYAQEQRGNMDVHSAGERRRHPRLYEPFAVRLRSVDAAGEVFEIDTVLDDFSAGGLYVRLTRRVEPGTRFFAVLRIATGPPSGTSAPYVAVRGVVVRVEPQPDGRYGVGVQFTRHRFL